MSAPSHPHTHTTSSSTHESSSCKLFHSVGIYLSPRNGVAHLAWILTKHPRLPTHSSPHIQQETKTYNRYAAASPVTR